MKVGQRGSNQQLVEVPPRICEYAPYDFLILGASTSGYRSSNPDKIAVLLAGTWAGMMRRCYDPAYKNYGAKGISVCERWQRVSEFIADVKLLHGWEAKLGHWCGYQLDKDYYSSNQYSPATCVWLTISENLSLNGLPVTATPPDGEKKTYISCWAAARDLGVSGPNISKYVARRTTVTKGKLIGYIFNQAVSHNPLRHQL